MEKETTKKIYTAYSARSDMTFIMQDIIDETGEKESTEVVGFYFGAPNFNDTIKYFGKTKEMF